MVKKFNLEGVIKLGFQFIRIGTFLGERKNGIDGHGALLNIEFSLQIDLQYNKIFDFIL